jgi:hypothetical protein
MGKHSITGTTSQAGSTPAILGGVIPDSSGGGGRGNGGVGSLANEGVGNGFDAPPPGQDYNFNDPAGNTPGNPGAKGGNGYDPHALAPLDLLGLGTLPGHF